MSPNGFLNVGHVPEKSIFGPPHSPQQQGFCHSPALSWLPRDQPKVGPKKKVGKKGRIALKPNLSMGFFGAGNPKNATGAHGEAPFYDISGGSFFGSPIGRT